MPLVSVIIAVYNGERFLGEAIDSILNQTFADFELIVVNDASTDNTQAILDNYADPRMIVLVNEHNLGPYGAANKGLAIARGKLIARHDADDISSADRLEQQVDRMQAQPGLVLLGTSYEVIDATGQVLELAKLPTDNDTLQKRLEYGTIFLHGTIMMQHDVLKKIGYYRDYFHVSQDYDIFLRLAEQGEIANLPDCLYKFRFHGDSLSRNKRELQLACRRLAWTLAYERRTKGFEETKIPKDVIRTFPPEPYRLFREARGKAFLNYVSKKYDLAAAAIAQAQEIYSVEDVSKWEAWALSKGHVLANQRNDPYAGACFIDWLLNQLVTYEKNHNLARTIGRYYVDQAFIAFEKGQSVWPMVWQAVRYDRRWLSNRGVWALLKNSLTKTYLRNG
jgi:glycosyltransferase involved in cell wall biosynthesis